MKEKTVSAPNSELGSLLLPIQINYQLSIINYQLYLELPYFFHFNKNRPH